MQIKQPVPRIDWNNPITKKLVMYLAFFEGGGNPLDLVSKLTATPTGTNWSKEPWGTGFNFVSASSSKLVTQFTAHNQLRSYEVLLRRTGAGGSNLGRIFDKRTSGAQVELWFYNNPWEFDRVFSGGQGTWKFADPVGVGPVQHLILTYDSGNIANDPIMYVNGIPTTVTSDGNPASGTANTNAEAYVIGNRANDNGRGFDGPFAYFRAYDRILTPQEAKQLAANPFCIHTRVKPKGTDSVSAGAFNPALTRRRLLLR